jgi:hypothetical protein
MVLYTICIYIVEAWCCIKNIVYNIAYTMKSNWVNWRIPTFVKQAPWVGARFEMKVLKLTWIATRFLQSTWIATRFINWTAPESHEIARTLSAIIPFQVFWNFMNVRILRMRHEVQLKTKLKLREWKLRENFTTSAWLISWNATRLKSARACCEDQKHSTGHERCNQTHVRSIYLCSTIILCNVC